jgi:hypothetical protein
MCLFAGETARPSEARTGPLAATSRRLAVPEECASSHVSSHMYIYTEADFGWAFINPDFSCATLMKDIKMTTAYWGEEVRCLVKHSKQRCLDSSPTFSHS